MRLIDADELMKKEEYLPLGFKSNDMRVGFHGVVTAAAIENAPTVAPSLPTREQVEAWKGDWIDVTEAYNDVPKYKCSRCGKVYIDLKQNFCRNCGAPMTDEAVDIIMKRLEALKGNG